MEVTRDYVLAALQALENLHDDVGVCIAHSGIATPDSLGQREVLNYVRPASVHTAHSQGALLVEVAADQLMACVSSIREPINIFGAFSCLRALLEASALATWLFDNQIDVHERVRRSFAYRYEGFRQQEKLANLDGDEAILAKIRQRLEETERVAITECGFSSVTNRKGQRNGIGMQMPPITEIIQLTLKREKDYRICSAVTHAHLWACQRMGFREVGRSETLKFVNLEKAVIPTAVGYILTVASVVFIRPIWYAALLFGWDTEKLIESADRHLEAIQIQRHLRPWYESNSASGL